MQQIYELEQEILNMKEFGMPSKKFYKPSPKIEKKSRKVSTQILKMFFLTHSVSIYFFSNKSLSPKSAK